MGDTRLEPLVLSDAERQMSQGWATRRKTAQGLALRARIVLACAEGRSNTAVAARLRVSRVTVTKWRARFLARRLDGLGDEPRPGVPRTISDAQVEEVVVRTLEEVPEGAMHWSKRELARRVGISPTSVHRPIDRTSGPVDLLRPGLAMGQASSSLITRTEAGWARRLAGVTCGDWLSPGSGRCARRMIPCCRGSWWMRSASGSVPSMTS
jgi:transposase